jgi:hypothetical protein
VKPDALSLARRDTAPAREWLTARYGFVPAVVLFAQRAEGGPVRIGRAQRLVHSVRSLHLAGHGPVRVRAVVPGGRALEAWFHRRHRERCIIPLWYGEPDNVIADARRFGDAHAQAFAAIEDMRGAGVAALRELDPHLADFERLHRAGRTLVGIAQLAGITPEAARAEVDRMRALGFHVPHRRVYVRKGTT